MRLLLSPRWMVWHVLTLGAMVTCTWLAIWQWGRAGSAMGSALNVGYGLQWPLFAVFFGVMWWRFLSMEIADLRAAEVAGTSGDSAGAMDTDSPTVPAQQAAGAAPSPVAGTTPSALTTTARTTAAPMPAAPTATTPAAPTATTPATTPAAPTATTPDGTIPDGTTAAPTPAGTTATPAGPSPFTSRPANAVPPRSTDPQLRAYNEELARLAVRHREESTP
ncbi:hypothetical protein [Pseudonocardia sp. HH130629-09]|uniref:hypothetical protein n=1 Tax=Pseudonocardia sp. HH130629-09 TaxID=1641402 RepID=UPI001EE71995|nr:hypothetical protein [Pseudonocardia sp. HH130629-09]